MDTKIKKKRKKWFLIPVLSSAVITIRVCLPILLNVYVNHRYGSNSKIEKTISDYFNSRVEDNECLAYYKYDYSEIYLPRNTVIEIPNELRRTFGVYPKILLAASSDELIFLCDADGSSQKSIVSTFNYDFTKKKDVCSLQYSWLSYRIHALPNGVTCIASQTENCYYVFDFIKGEYSCSQSDEKYNQALNNVQYGNCEQTENGILINIDDSEIIFDDSMIEAEEREMMKKWDYVPADFVNFSNNIWIRYERDKIGYTSSLFFKISEDGNKIESDQFFPFCSSINFQCYVYDSLNTDLMKK